MKELEIAGIKIKNRYIQAPLAGYTTLAMRELDYDYGCDFAYTEMNSCSAICHSSSRTFEMLPKAKERGKVALQLFGGDLQEILQAIEFVEKHAIYDFLDFNFGCPVPKVIKQHAGSSFLLRPNDMYEVTRAMVIKSSKPVICKIRLGFKEFNYLETTKLLEQAGVKAIAVHGRTQKEGFQGNVHYDYIAEIKKNVSIPIIANGGICLSNIDEVENITKADGFMFGKESMGNPKLFEDLINKEEGRKIREKDISEVYRNMLKHLDILITEKGERLACQLFRGIACYYLKSLPNMKEIKLKIFKFNTYQEYRDLFTSFIK